MLDPETIVSPDEASNLPWGAVLYEELPAASAANIRPFAWAILLTRGAVRPQEIVAAAHPHIRMADQRVGLFTDHDQTRLERIVDEVIGSWVAQGILRPAPDDKFVLGPAGTARATTIACDLDAQLPAHLLVELSRRPPSG